MRKEIRICDRCKKAECHTEPIRVMVGTEPDPSGNSSYTVTEEIDLCPACMRDVLSVRIKQLDQQTAREWVEAVRREWK